MRPPQREGGRPGLQAAGWAVSRADARAADPAESLTQLLSLRLDGSLPMPLLPICVQDPGSRDLWLPTTLLREVSPLPEPRPCRGRRLTGKRLARGGGAGVVLPAQRREAQRSSGCQAGGGFSTRSSFPWGARKTAPAYTGPSVMGPSMTSRPHLWSP